MRVRTHPRADGDGTPMAEEATDVAGELLEATAAARSSQLAASSEQPAAWRLQRATCSSQLGACNWSRAARGSHCSLQLTAYAWRLAARSSQPAAYKFAACSTQLAACSLRLQLTARSCSVQLSACSSRPHLRELLRRSLSGRPCAASQPQRGPPAGTCGEAEEGRGREPSSVGRVLAGFPSSFVGVVPDTHQGCVAGAAGACRGGPPSASRGRAGALWISSGGRAAAAHAGGTCGCGQRLDRGCLCHVHRLGGPWPEGVLRAHPGFVGGAAAPDHAPEGALPRSGAQARRLSLRRVRALTVPRRRHAGGQRAGPTDRADLR